MRPVDPQHASLVEEWTKIQLSLSKRASFEDSALSFDVPRQSSSDAPAAYDSSEVTKPIARHLRLSAGDFRGLSIIAGLDISTFSEGSRAVVQLAVLSFPDLELLDTISSVVNIDEPYIPSFLAMREANPLVHLLRTYKRAKPEMWPQIILVDGNGRLHERQAGLAVSIGVELDLPCIGIAKEYYPISTVECFGADSSFRSHQKTFKHVVKELLHNQGDYLLIPDAAGQSAIGAAVYTSATPNSSRAVFVSSGHRVGLHTAMHLACACARDGRLPLPVKIADSLSRAAVKEHEQTKA